MKIIAILHAGDCLVQESLKVAVSAFRVAVSPQLPTRLQLVDNCLIITECCYFAANYIEIPNYQR
jgi:hypothetical protein